MKKTSFIKTSDTCDIAKSFFLSRDAISRNILNSFLSKMFTSHYISVYHNSNDLHLIHTFPLFILSYNDEYIYSFLYYCSLCEYRVNLHSGYNDLKFICTFLKFQAFTDLLSQKKTKYLYFILNHQRYQLN
jgi:hypothetical protein